MDDAACQKALSRLTQTQAATIERYARVVRTEPSVFSPLLKSTCSPQALREYAGGFDLVRAVLLFVANNWNKRVGAALVGSALASTADVYTLEGNYCEVRAIATEYCTRKLLKPALKRIARLGAADARAARLLMIFAAFRALRAASSRARLDARVTADDAAYTRRAWFERRAALGLRSVGPNSFEFRTAALAARLHELAARVSACKHPAHSGNLTACQLYALYLRDCEIHAFYAKYGRPPIDRYLYAVSLEPRALFIDAAMAGCFAFEPSPAHLSPRVAKRPRVV
jgi:hypothetical protein